MGSDLIPVVYMGGACGDLVCALIDLRGATFDVAAKKMALPLDRQRLKKPHTFADDSARDLYLEEMAHSYLSVPSHDLDYHMRRGHAIIGITVQDKDTALWAARRFRDSHRPQVWKQVAQGWHINSIDEYAQLLLDHSARLQHSTDRLLTLEHIRSGTVIPCIERLIGRDLGRDAVNCYKNWQHIQNGTFVV